jgi:hypothetical protein
MFYITLFLTALGLFTLIGGLAYMSLIIEEKLINKNYDFESRLLNGEILSKDNIF